MEAVLLSAESSPRSHFHKLSRLTEHRSWRIVTGKTGLTHTGAVIDVSTVSLIAACWPMLPDSLS